MAVVVLVSEGAGGARGLPSLAGLGGSARRTLSGVWAYRANAEREAEARFRRLARELAEVGAPPEAISLAERAVRDEQRHAALCVALATHYGGGSPALGPVEDVPLGPRQASLAERVLYEAVAFCCITETLNSALMQVAHEHARVPEARAALRSILRDEVQHSRIGWAHLGTERQRGTGLGPRELSLAIPRMLAGAVREELFSPGPDPRDAEALARHGELSEALRLEIFESCLRDVIGPGLEAAGIDTGPMRGWARRMRG